MRLRIGNTRLRVGSVRLAVGSGSAPVAPSTPVTPAAVAPSQVGNLTAGAPGTVTIPVTYTAATGTGPIAYAGQTRLHGSTAFTPNNGVFSATNGQFVGLAAGTGYDVQVVATNSAGSTVTTLLNITTNSNPVYVPPAPTKAANKYFLILDQVAVAPGDTVTGAAYPNGLWPTTSGRTITLSNGVVISLPTTGGAAATFSFTAGAAGEYSISSTNNAGLYDPYYAPLTVFATSSGTARTLSVALGAPPGVGIDNQPFRAPLDMTTFQRDTVTGQPRGFASSFSRGAGEVWLAISALGGSTDGLFLQLFDSFSSGATAAAGTGTEVTAGPVQVHGPITGAGTVRVMLPGSSYTGLYADVATDAAMTNRARIAQRFRIGEVIGLGTRSQETGAARTFPYGGSVPTGQTYAKTTSLVSYDPRYGIPDGTPWYLQDGVHQDTNQYHGDWTSSGAQEIGRIIEQEQGVVCAIAGAAGSGGGFDEFVNSDGTPNGGLIPSLDYAVAGKFRMLWMCMGGLDSGTETLADDQARTVGFSNWIAAHRPFCGVIGWCHGASGWFSNDGSSDLGHTRTQQISRDLEASNPMVVSKENTIWNEFATSNAHASMASRPYFVHSSLRLMRAALPVVAGGTATTQRGPTLATTGFLSGGKIRVGFKLNGAGALLPKGFNFTDPTSTVDNATPAEIASLWSVFAGAGGRAGAGTAVPIAAAEINTSSPPAGYDGTIDLTPVSALTGSTYTAHYAADYGVCNSTLAPAYHQNTRSAALCDDRLDLGLQYGWHMRPQLDIAVSA